MSKPIHRADPLHSTALTAALTASDALSILEDTRCALPHCNDVAQLLKLRDQAEAIRQRLKSDALGLDMLNCLAIVRLHCEHRAGTILKQLVKRGGNHRGANSLPRSQLQELGIKNKMQSSRLQAVASISEDDISRFVNQLTGEQRAVSTKGLLRCARLACSTLSSITGDNDGLASVSAGLASLAKQNKRFCCIYASPDWSGDRKDGVVGLAKKLSQLPVKEISAANAHAHLAVRPERIKDGIAILDKWGFHYRGELVLNVPRSDFGDHWKCSHVSLLLGVRGRLPFRDTALPSWFGKHDLFDSANPNEVRDLIVRVSPAPYLDLLADKRERQWTSPILFSRQGKADGISP